MPKPSRANSPFLPVLAALQLSALDCHSQTHPDPLPLAPTVPVTHAPPIPAPTPAAPTKFDPVTLLLRESLQLLQQKQYDAALDKVNAALKLAPQNPGAYGLRGGIYAQQKQWDSARQDVEHALQLDGGNVQLKFNRAEIDFMQKKYDLARPGFVALQKDPEIGDFAAFKTFLCDLFGGHETEASQEYDAFNRAGSNASYYFGNAAWFLYHQKPEEARGWLVSAVHIYSPGKIQLYTSSLRDLGYLPLPDPPRQ